MKRSGGILALAMTGVMALPAAAAANDDHLSRIVHDIITGQSNAPGWGRDWERGDHRFPPNRGWSRHDDDDDGRRRGRATRDDDDDDDGRRRGWRHDDDDDDGQQRRRGHDDDD